MGEREDKGPGLAR